ncbi:MAG TPA: Hsp20/alpha crystallin family protein [Thermoanaerobaculia bacterium]|nr:Hsp20/alpha crystallin family protein [Thermoanaerobaculia bacterium]
MTTAITRWNPETELYRNRLDRMFNQMLQDFWGAQGPSEPVGGRVWMPAVDIKETEEALHFSVELPGMTKEEVAITLENNVLTISGERKFEKETKKGEEYHRLERSYGAFSRSFTVPGGVQTDKVDAKFADGVLTIALPKQENAKPRKIQIR